MLKYVIAVAFLSYVALGDNINPFDRSSSSLTSTSNVAFDDNTGEWGALCNETCYEYCVDCKEPKRCGDNETYCGTMPIDPNMHQCTPDEICVPEECQCK